MSYIDEHLEFLARHEGTKGAKTRVEDKTKAAAPFGLDNPPIPRKNNESDKAYAKRVLEYFDAEATAVLGDSYNRAPKNVKRAVLDNYYNSGRLYPGQINSLKNNDYLGFAKNTLDTVSANDPQTGGSGVLKGLANRRAETYNLMADDVKGLSRITGGELQNIDGKARLIYQTEKEPISFDFQKPLHSSSKVGNLNVLGSQQVQPEQSVYDKGLGAIKQFRNYLGFKKGGDVKEEKLTINAIENMAPMLYYDRLQEMARRSMMLGNEQDRMEDYDYAKLLAERPFVNRYPVDSRGQGAYSTAAPMGMQAQRMMGFAGGGMVNDAQGLASLGRGGDSMLVHMQPQEVAGLQRLAEQSGTSLTKNPYTGMPEAFSLGGVLKAAVPVAAGYFTGGAGYGLGLQLAAGAAAGGTLAALTGDDPFMGAVSGGMGGVSGGGLADFMGAGLGPESIGAGGWDPTTGAVQSLSNQQALNMATSGQAGAIANTPASIQAGQGPNFNATIVNKTPRSLGFSDFFENPSKAFQQAEVNLGKNVPTGGFDPKTGDPRTVFQPATKLQTAMKLGSPVASTLMGGIEESDLIPDFEPDKSDEAYNPNARLNLNMDTGISEALKRDSGLRLLAQGGYLDGGRIGDGMSDSVRANIDGQQEARLSEGEFVVPADVVSHLGNGSSDAGAKRLYDMMDKVRKARTGTKQQGKEISPGKYMPR
jgi:GH24 family phage-related lysozyme (muramidase)